MRHSRLFQSFLSNKSGNIAVIFAIAMLPMLLFTGAAVDYSVTSNKREQVRSALDSAVLAGTIAGKAALDSGSGNTAAITAAKTAAANFFSGNSKYPATLAANFTITGSTLTGSGSASASVPTSFMYIMGVPNMTFTLQSASSASAQPYVNVYLLVDISASMLLPSTSAGITTMTNGQGCALACHWDAGNNDSYGWALNNGVQLRYQVVNQGVQNLLTYLGNNSTLKSHVKVGLWAFDNTLSQMSAMTSNYSMVSSNFPTPGVAVDDATAATPFNSYITNFVASVGAAGDGSSSASPKKIVIIATDGVNDPTRAWTWNTPLRSQVQVFDTTFCTAFQTNGVTVAIINTPYLPMTWDWGYNATLGQPGSLGGATRVDDVPIALSACAGKYFTVASDVASIQSAFVNLFNMTSPIHITQ